MSERIEGMSNPSVASQTTGSANPLLDTLFRQTTLSPVVASAAPVRERGTHSRAGNAMNRTRSALMSGAAQSVQVSGTKLTMSQIAAASGVAKATLYNHFRTRDAVLAALVLAEVDAVATAQGAQPLAQALAGAAVAISSSPVRAGLAQVEPATLAALARIDPIAPAWARAHSAVTDALAEAGRSGVDTVLRWLASFLVNPADVQAIESDVAVLLAGLPVVDSVEMPKPA